MYIVYICANGIYTTRSTYTQMANRKYLLFQKIIDVQDDTIREQKRGVSNEWIYKNIIRNKYYISRQTFYRYLGFNVRREAKEQDIELTRKK